MKIACIGAGPAGLYFAISMKLRDPRHEVHLFERNAEGTLEWIELEKIHELPLWEGDRHFLPLIFDADPRPFHGVMPYRDGRMVSWSFSRI